MFDVVEFAVILNIFQCEILMKVVSVRISSNTCTPKAVKYLQVLACIRIEVNKQDFLQVFQSNGIGKMEDNLTNADPLSYTTNGLRVDQVSLVSVS